MPVSVEVYCIGILQIGIGNITDDGMGHTIGGEDAAAIKTAAGKLDHVGEMTVQGGTAADRGQYFFIGVAVDEKVFFGVGICEWSIDDHGMRENETQSLQFRFLLAIEFLDVNGALQPVDCPQGRFL